MSYHWITINRPGDPDQESPQNPHESTGPEHVPGRAGRRRRIERWTALLAALVSAGYLWLTLPADGIGLANTLWTAGTLLIAFAAGYLALRRAALAFVLAVLLVAGGLWAIAPRPSSERSGDRQLLSYVDMFGGLRDVSVAVIDLNSAQPVRFANTGSAPTTRFEIGSITKALTGLAIADAVKRGEVNLAAPVSTYLPLRGSPAGAATMQQLLTHRSGYPQFGRSVDRRAIWALPLGRNILNSSLGQTIQDARGARPIVAGGYAYSTLGAALAGQATARAAGLSYPDLMRTRLFQPLGMHDTAIQTSTPLVAGGRAAMGRPMRPWPMTGYAPGGAAVSTSKDLSVLVTAMLRGRAPGLDALTPIAPADLPGRMIGMFWITSRTDDGRVITWHSGETAGYTSYVGLDRQHQRAVVVLSDDAAPVYDLAQLLFTDAK